MAEDIGPVSSGTNTHSAPQIDLTSAEQAWLQQHPKIRIGFDPAWPPYSYYSADNQMVGLDIDFLKLVAARLGITFVPVTGRNWSEVYAKAKTGEVDMFSGMALTPERANLFNFTGPYIDFPVGLVTRTEAPFMIGLPELKGSIVAMPRDYAPTLLLQRDYPDIHLILTDTTGSAFQLVSSGSAFATMDNLPSACYLIKDRGLANLKVAGITRYDFALRYAVRKDWPILPGILQKALGSISSREREGIKDKWIDLDVDEMLDSHRYGGALLMALEIVAVLVLLVLVWNWTLAREVVRRKNAEAELREARNKAVDANQMKSAFLANLSHEIRNPLDALLGFTALLKLEPTNAKFRRFVEAIDAGGRTLLGVINDILDLSKVEAGRLEIHRAPVDLRVVLAETHALFSLRAEKKEIEFTHEVDADFPALLSLDELRLRQILYNTVSNAIKFTEHGSVRLKASFNRKDPEASNGVLTLHVMDSGVGIPPEDQKRIFEPFAQRAGQSPLLGGTGLGLAISKRFTELMNGRLEMESQVGRGTTFRFIFQDVPIEASPPVPTSVPTSESLADFVTLKVLLVDDLPMNRELFKEYFERADHVVWEADDGEQGIEMVRTHLPDLVLLDYHLPGINGVEVARQLAEDPATAKIRVVFLSGSVINPTELANTAQIMVLGKPLAYADLVAALRRLLPHAIRKP